MFLKKTFTNAVSNNDGSMLITFAYAGYFITSVFLIKMFLNLNVKLSLNDSSILATHF